MLYDHKFHLRTTLFFKSPWAPFLLHTVAQSCALSNSCRNVRIYWVSLWRLGCVTLRLELTRNRSRISLVSRSDIRYGIQVWTCPSKSTEQHALATSVRFTRSTRKHLPSPSRMYLPSAQKDEKAVRKMKSHHRIKSTNTLSFVAVMLKIWELRRLLLSKKTSHLRFPTTLQSLV